MKSLLIGEAATGADIARVRAVFAADPRVERIVSLETQQLGPDELFVGAHVVLDDALSGEDAARAIDEIVAAVQAQVPEARRVFVEPEVA